jgi:hypothetical protein
MFDLTVFNVFFNTPEQIKGFSDILLYADMAVLTVDRFYALTPPHMSKITYIF